MYYQRKADELEQVVKIFEMPENLGRDLLTVASFRYVRAHNEYYGVYLTVAIGKAKVAAHISLLHCAGCCKSLTAVQIQRIEVAAGVLVGMRIPLSKMELHRDYRSGRLWRAWGTIDVREPFNRILWGLRCRLSSWLPAASHREHRDNFHISFDEVM